MTVGEGGICPRSKLPFRDTTPLFSAVRSTKVKTFFATNVPPEPVSINKSPLPAVVALVVM
jgi:hypothetical protein